MKDVFICAYRRTAFGRFGGALASVRPDDLGAVPIHAIMADHPNLDWTGLDDVIFGNANQAGEDNRNVARMSALLAGLPVEVPGVTLNRLCGSGMDAVLTGARAIAAGEAELILAGGTESMSRAPFVLPKATDPFSRKAEIHDTTIGWRFVNPVMKARYGVDSMPETAENLAEEFQISRDDQDAFALRSQEKAAAAIAAGRLAEEIVPVEVPRRKSDPVIVDVDEHPRATTAEALAKLPTPFRESGGSVTAGNASGINDGAAALLLASAGAVERHGLTPLARVLGGATAGVPPRIMGYGPVPAVRKLLDRIALSIDEFDLIELNEAFAAQALACTRALDLPDDDSRLNPNGGAIALGHPLGASGARLVGTATLELARSGGRYALASMCIGVGQGIALALEAVRR
ncbi:3-oxoadipyl-CoA thiolase [Palleronia aestuarii]|uniref:Beta-ketoadipyl-CoA thiolase n=1 Tax=Palleronia aestuarii TaxID=568105 RepID=A0A2W7NAJ2_9RHOB|nr:3-oxoadipyl-CoA thiolase [Palleronia aestuarii]PZX15097.1 3-oxoadipyl-CoA thiolase [Palleronia aestuarii]